MNKKEAKERTVQIWDYLADHPEIDDKEDLPDNLFNLIRDCFYQCPLCEVFRPNDKVNTLRSDYLNKCNRCPIAVKHMRCNNEFKTSYLDIWENNDGIYSNEQRSEAAKGIADIARNWNIEDEVIQ